MADYLPKFFVGAKPTILAGSGGVTGGKLIEHDGTVSAAASLTVIGVAATDAAVGDPVTYFPLPGQVHYLTAGTGGVTAGQLVKSDASGNVVTATSGTDADAAILGIALTTATATNVAEILGK
ncbi:capsid cement protein [Nocardioides sp. GY 10127]|uniref:capsid cement protein n=1 Tax=Nocardioides sp. GY 10127 TaxID=2569762 RepID=UPI0010A9444C|nr:capsid cement protein [Nocardioides sp. GY 10127]TIC78785.1 DUF2190 family protein [Nocardioides sp. GY 10127]